MFPTLVNLNGYAECASNEDRYPAAMVSQFKPHRGGNALGE